MKYSSAVLLALGNIAGGGQAFVVPTVIWSGRSGRVWNGTPSNAIRMEMVGGMADNDDFLDALRPGKKSNNDDNDDDEVSQGSESSRFRELMKAAKLAGGAERQRFPRAIENPFLNPPPPPAATIPQQPLPYVASSNPADLSVEEQARMFREMMAQQQQQQQPAAAQLGAILPPPPPRVAKTDRAGRPVGRNRDADSIANTADLYFAQLKRDSTVRTIARLRGDDDIADQVFADEGIKQLDELLQKNPYLQGQKDDEMRMIETIQNEVLAPYFESSRVREEDLPKSGISYKQKLMERRQRGHQTASPTPAPAETVVPEPEAVIEQQNSDDATTPPLQPEPVVNVPLVPQTASPSAIASPPATNPMSSAPVNPEDTRKNIRTLMGLILKHRGGPGFGKGRLNGPEIDRFDELLQEVTAMLREEATLSHPNQSSWTSMPSPASTATVTVVEPTPVSPRAVPQTQASPAAATNDVSSIDGTIACIEGAIIMYKNSPPLLQQTILVTLRSALVAAVDSCNAVLSGQPPPPAVPGNPEGKIDGVIACIEGAITMYKNSPPQLRESVLVTLRVALMSAVETCNDVMSGVPPLQQQAVVGAPAPVATTPLPVTLPTPVPTPVATVSPSVIGTDRNSRAIEKIHESMKVAHGDGRLGLRNDLTPAEAVELADQLVDMRKMLMEELEGGIPDPEPAEASTGVNSESSASKYMAMLAKARAEKATA